MTNWTEGKKIAEPGVYTNVPMESYHGDLCDGPSVSSSGLRKIFLQSPRHFYQTSYLNPDRTEGPDSLSMMLGRAAHHLFLGQKDFQRYFIVRPAVWSDWRTAAAKDWREKALKDGFTVLTPEQMTHITGMAKALSEEPLIQHGALSGKIERSIVFKEPSTGLWIKVRPDATPSDSGDFTDIKVMASVDDETISRSIGNYGYDMQGALVGWASKMVLGREMNSFSLVCVESSPPYCVSTVTLKPSDLQEGHENNLVSLRLLKKCLDTGYWPGPGGRQNDAKFLGKARWFSERDANRRAQLEKELEE